LEIQDIPLPELVPGEILLKVHACGVCHSDHNVVNGDFGPPYVLLSSISRSHHRPANPIPPSTAK
jgi:D-arabinose 1-dehydrogenase-like Zn-dependent alcohol dehydrogenase